MPPTTSYAERRKQALRAEIIEAAFDVFAERGYHDAGVADIAERIGIGHSTFYRQFQSKRDVLDAVIDTVLERTITALAAENAPEAANTLEQYRAQVHRLAAAFDDIASDQRIVRTLLVQSLSVDTDLEQRLFGMYELWVALTATYIVHGQAGGYISADVDATATARAVVGLIIGTAVLGMNPALGSTQRTDTINAAVALMFDGITRR